MISRVYTGTIYKHDLPGRKWKAVVLTDTNFASLCCKLEGRWAILPWATRRVSSKWQTRRKAGTHSPNLLFQANLSGLEIGGG